MADERSEPAVPPVDRPPVPPADRPSAPPVGAPGGLQPPEPALLAVEQTGPARSAQKVVYLVPDGPDPAEAVRRGPLEGAPVRVLADGRDADGNDADGWVADGRDEDGWGADGEVTDGEDTDGEASEHRDWEWVEEW